MKLSVVNQTGEKVKDLNISEVFETKVGAALFTQYVNYLRAASRNVVADTLGRGEVSGGGKKPYKQKGTGSARQGSTRSPLWVGGGVTFGPNTERNFNQRMNRQSRRKAILGLISNIIAGKAMIVVENLDMAEIKTKTATEMLEKIGAQGKIAVICNIENENARLSFRNIAGVKVMSPAGLDFIYLSSSDKVVVTADALAEIEKMYGASRISEKKENE